MNDMSNVYTIYLNEHLYQLLERDFQNFHFKSRGPFIKAIIANYYEEFNKEFSDIESKIITKIEKEKGIIPQNLNSICWEIAKIKISNICTHHQLETKEKKNKKISLRKNTDDTFFETLEDFFPETNISVNEYFNTILYSYINLSKTKREKIVFKPAYEKLQKAINKRKLIKLTYYSNTTGEEYTETVLPYEICPHKDQMYNYVLFQGPDIRGKTNIKTVHLYNVKKVIIKKEVKEFDKKVLTYFERMKKNGPQFFINDYDQIIRLKFLKNGKKTYDLRYIERPVGTLIDEQEQIYEFDCSYLQFSSYFAPFYDKIQIIEPQKYIERLTSTLHKTSQIYK